MRNSMILRPGDKIGLVSGARWVDASVVETASKQITAWGYEPVVAPHALSRHNQLAGTDEERASDVQMMLDDNSIKAILFMRGGYGTIRIIDKLDFTQFTLHPKWICGFSDYTILHSHINDKLGLPTLHCTMPYSFPTNTPESISIINEIWRGNYAAVQSPQHAFNKQGNASGILVGGNLSILYSLLGTKFGFSTAGKILFIEDLDEYVYHIDRMMMSLKLAGKLDFIKGIIVGGMSDMKDHEVSFGATAEEIILSHVKHLSIPICFDFPAGHISNNRPIILGTQVNVEVNNHGAVLSYI